MDPARIASFALALLFLLTAMAKVQGPQIFMGLIEKLGLTGGFNRVLFYVVVALESMLAGAWATGWWPEGLGLLTAALFLLFVVLLEMLWRKGHRETCGCYGGLANVNPRQGIKLNLIYAAMSIFVWSEAGDWPRMPFPLWALFLGLGLAGISIFRLRPKA